jgi:hypothetical protein
MPPFSCDGVSSSLLGDGAGVSATDEPLRKSQRTDVESLIVGTATVLAMSPSDPLLRSFDDSNPVDPDEELALLSAGEVGR